MRPLFIGALILLASGIYLAAALLQERQRTIELERELAQGSLRLALAEEEARAFIDLVQQYDLNQGSFVYGYDVVSGEEISLASVDSAVVYITSVDCVWSSTNVPTLNLMSDSLGIPVIGISLRDPPDRLRRFAAEHSVRFPMISNPGGVILNAVPRHATPITLLIGSGRVQSIQVGDLDGFEGQ